MLHTNPNNLKEACMKALQTQRSKATTQDGLKFKLLNKKCVMESSHVLGWYIP